MPVTHKSNNRILPANSRAVDVARQALRDLAPVQQRRHANAFEVDGRESVVYTKLLNGTPCSCMAHHKAANAMLDEDGKMPIGRMNEMLGGMEFRVNRYGTRTAPRQDLRAEREMPPLQPGIDPPQREPLLPGGTRLPDADYLAMNLDDEVATQIGVEGQAVNGPVRALTLDDYVEDFDDDVNMSDSACTVCYGRGFVGGFSVLGGWRAALSTQWLPKPQIRGTVEINKTPHAFFANEVTFQIVLPKGFVYLDCFRFWNNKDRITPLRVTIDNLDFSTELFAAFCDGRQHSITVYFEEMTYWTHLEIQVAQTRHPAMIEFPKLTKGANQSFEDPTEDVSISASGLIPNLGPGDVIVESTRGKGFMVNSVTPWSDSKRNIQGWSCNARVVQQSELIGALPRRRKLAQLTTNAVRDNVDGPRRT